jgi:transposase
VPSVASASRSKKVLRASERDEAQRAAWRTAIAERDPGTLVFVDETGTNLAMTRRYGRAKRGARVVGQVPRNPGPNVTLLAAMDREGLLGELTLTGATDGDAFEAYVTRVLVPHLWPGDLVIWDNLSAHKRARARIWVESAGAQVLFLPPYSPDFNPIELAFSKLKAALRRAGARTRAELDQAITAALGTITSQDAQAWFAHCGYSPSPQLL